MVKQQQGEYRANIMNHIKGSGNDKYRCLLEEVVGY